VQLDGPVALIEIDRNVVVHEIIAASQGHETKASAEKGIEAIKTHAPNAHVEDHTEAKSS